MARVICEVEETEVEFKDKMVPGIIVTCSRCNESVQCGGISDRSVKRCFAMLRDNCPLEEENYYTEDSESDD